MKFIIVTLFALLCAFVVEPSEKARYDNYRVHEIFIDNEEQLKLMQEIDRYPDGYRFWEYPGEVGMKVELMVPPHKFGEFSELSEKFNLKQRIMINNLQEVFDNEQPEQPKRQPKAAINWTSYSTYAQINTWLDELVAQYPASVSHINVGESHEGRAIRGVKVNIGGGTKKKVIFEGTMHAREWISTATTTWMLNELLTSTDPEVMDIARQYEWYVLPVVNPDGYSYTWTNDRAWRKTRRPSNLLCFGADPNRNWDHHFAEGGASTNPCSDTYAGERAFSEPETQALSTYFNSIRADLVGYFAFHAYGQLMMLPYGWTRNPPTNYETLMRIGTIGMNALQAKYGTNYKIGSIANIIYIASGSSVDWVADRLSTPLTFAYEFRDEGRYGFSLPADQIIPNSVEIFASIIAIMKEGRASGIA